MPAQRTGILGKQEPEPSGSSVIHLSSQPTRVLASSNSLDILSGGVSGGGTVASVGGKPIFLQTVSTGNPGTIKLNHADIEKLLSQSGNANASGAVTLLTQSGAGVSEDGAAAVVQTVSAVAEPKAGMKRSLPASMGSPMVTKVIITKSPGSNQPQAVPVGQGGQQLPVAISLQGGGLSMISQSLLSSAQASPTKTVTLTSQGVVSPGKTVIATLPGTPPKAIPISSLTKVPLSPVKSPPKIHMIPVSIAKTPQKLGGQQTLLAKSVSDLTVTQAAALSNSSAKPITMSPSKVIIKQGPVMKATPQIAPAGTRPVLPISVATSVQQISVPGSKFHYVRLVAPSQASVANSTSTTTTAATVTKTALTTGSMVQAARQIAPATLAPTNPTPSQVKITLPLQGAQLVTPKPMGSSSGASVQRILLPAPNQPVTVRAPVTVAPPTTLTQLRPTPSGNPSTLNLPPGTTLLSSAASIPGLHQFALVPATYMSQLNKQTVTQASSTPTAAVAVKQQRSDYVPIASSDPAVSANVLARNTPQNGTTLEATGARPRKPCNCTKSQCLKLYCDCFANGEFCHNCNCTNCANNLEHEEERSRAIKSCLDRNPMAFHPKIGKGRSGDSDRRHNKGCNCKRSGCLKNYCECYEAKIMCSSTCKCVGCKNFEESPERKNLMHLADAAEVRVQQAQAAKSKLASQISGLPTKPPPTSVGGERLPYTLITTEVAEAMCACLLAQAEEAERLKTGSVVQERLVLEEFGRCLMQIIDSANNTKDDNRDGQ